MSLEFTYINADKERLRSLKKAFPNNKIITLDNPDPFELMTLRIRSVESLLHNAGEKILLHGIVPRDVTINVGGGYDIADQAFYIVDEAGNSQTIEEQINTVLFLLESRKARAGKLEANKIVLITSRQEEVASYINSPPENSPLSLVKSYDKSIDDVRIVNTLNSDAANFPLVLDSALGGALSKGFSGAQTKNHIR